MRWIPRQSAFALIEALVALVLLSVALGGSVVLLVQALRAERLAGERSRAVRHAASLADTLRALRRADGRPLQAVVEPGNTPTCATDPMDCVLDDLAAGELEAWRTAAEADMPAGTAVEVSWLPEPAAGYVVALSWPAQGGGTDDSVRIMVQP